MTQKHTPGPWVDNWAGSGNDGKFVWDECYVYAPGTGVEDIAIASDITDPLTGKPSQANALLIASAPDLLEALKELLDDYGSIGYSDSLIAKVEAVIRKATGETT